MLKKVKYFAYILLLGYVSVNATSENEDKALNNFLQSKNIHILDLQGMLGALEINATFKDIKVFNIASNLKENILNTLQQRNVTDLMQLKLDQIEVHTAALIQLKTQISHLEDSIQYLMSLLSKSVETKMETSCLAFDSLGSVHLIEVPGIPAFNVLCDACGSETGWIVIQHRFDGSIDFYRDWNAYRNGFGYYNGEFFIGLEYIYRLTSSRPYELLIEIVDFGNYVYYARYDTFLIGSEQEKYMLKSIGTYSGNAGDSLKYNLYDKFSTYDNDNDGWYRGNCANYYESGWWFNWDANSNLNGRYYKSGERSSRGIWWYTTKGYYSLKSVKMLIRPKYTLV